MRISQLQLQVQPESGDEHVVEEVFASAGSKFSLFDTTDESEDSLCEYSQGVGFGPGFRARKVDGLIVMDFHSQEARAEEFSAAVEFVVSQILEHVGGRMTCVSTRYSLDGSERRASCRAR